MKNFLKTIIIACAAALIACIAAGCGSNNAATYDYLVTFDYNADIEGIDTVYENQYLGVKEGGRIMPPLSPNSEKYSSSDFKQAEISRYEVTGWYTAVYDENGNPKKDPETGSVLLDKEWNFATDRVTKDITLYANLVLRPKVTYYLDGKVARENHFRVGEDISRFKATGSTSKPTLSEKSFYGFFTDPVEGTEVTFPFSMGEDDIDIYARFIDGAGWEVVRTAQEFMSVFDDSKDTKIYVAEDLDFTGVTWWGKFTFNGEIDGRGNTLKNITYDVAYTRSDQTYLALFGAIGDLGNIHDITFDNVQVTVSTTSEMVAQGAFFAWQISDKAKINNVKVKNSSVKRGGSYSDGQINLTQVTVGYANGTYPSNCVGCDFTGITVV